MTFEGALAGLSTLGHPEVCLLQWGSLLVNVFIGSPSKSVSTDRSDCSHQMAWHALPHWHWMVGWVRTCRGFTDLRSVRSSAEEDCLACTIQRWTIRLQTRREQKSFCSRIHQSDRSVCSSAVISLSLTVYSMSPTSYDMCYDTAGSWSPQLNFWGRQVLQLWL